MERLLGLYFCSLPHLFYSIFNLKIICNYSWHTILFPILMDIFTLLGDFKKYFYYFLYSKYLRFFTMLFPFLSTLMNVCITYISSLRNFFGEWMRGICIIINNKNIYFLKGKFFYGCCFWENFGIPQMHSV